MISSRPFNKPPRHSTERFSLMNLNWAEKRFMVIGRKSNFQASERSNRGLSGAPVGDNLSFGSRIQRLCLKFYISNQHFTGTETPDCW